MLFVFFFQAEDGIRDYKVTGVQTCALPICSRPSECLYWHSQEHLCSRPSDCLCWHSQEHLCSRLSECLYWRSQEHLCSHSSDCRCWRWQEHLCSHPSNCLCWHSPDCLCSRPSDHPCWHLCHSVSQAAERHCGFRSGAAPGQRATHSQPACPDWSCRVQVHSSSSDFGQKRVRLLREKQAAGSTGP